jgi:hypothetical protein
MKDEELSLFELLEIAERDFHQQFEQCASYAQLAEICAVTASQLVAFGLAFLAVNEKMQAAHCMKQAIIGATAKSCALCSKVGGEIKFRKIV